MSILTAFAKNNNMNPPVNNEEKYDNNHTVNNTEYDKCAKMFVMTGTSKDFLIDRNCGHLKSKGGKRKSRKIRKHGGKRKSRKHGGRKSRKLRKSKKRRH